MGILHDKLTKLTDAFEEHEGIRPGGTPQAELRAMLFSVAEEFHALEAKVIDWENQHNPVSAVVRIEAKLDEILKRLEAK